jgi:putative DNA primase/helicase
VATIGRLPDTLADRCIVIRMQRKTSQEQCERLRNLDGTGLRQRCARFVKEHELAIAAGRPELPARLNDRAADIWEPLLVLADLAGGEWPERARSAAIGLSLAAEDSSPMGSLLFDIFLVIGSRPEEQMFSRDLMESLNRRAVGRAWFEARQGRALTEWWLAHELRRYGVRPRVIRMGPNTGRGYVFGDFGEMFRRYMPKGELEEYKKRVSERAQAASQSCAEQGK